MSDLSGATSSTQPIDPLRHSAALSQEIWNAWRTYRLRGDGLGLLVGVVVAGIIAPIATSSVLLAAALGGAPLADGPWTDVLWSLSFAIVVPWVGSHAFARLQPRRLRRAVETYIWLAAKAEQNFARTFGNRAVPRDEASMRAFLASIAQTGETAGERYGFLIALCELDRARSAMAEMPDASPRDRYERASAAWLLDFVSGTTRPIEPLERLAHDIVDDDERTEAMVGVAANQARAAVADRGDWETPLAAARDWIGSDADRTYDQHVRRPAFRRLLIATVSGLVVYWFAVAALRPLFPEPSNGGTYPILSTSFALATGGDNTRR